MESYYPRKQAHIILDISPLVTQHRFLLHSIIPSSSSNYVLVHIEPNILFIDNRGPPIWKSFVSTGQNFEITSVITSSLYFQCN